MPRELVHRPCSGLRVLCTAAVFVACSAQAQIVLDGSLNGGAFEALVGPGYTIPHDKGLIPPGSGNLFHSFDTFNIHPGESATFTGPAPDVHDVQIRNVLSRVTGGSVSLIDGLLAFDSNLDGASFFFINPTGVVFGSQASLDVPASFHVSTADYIALGDGVRFTAAMSTADAMLSAAAPAAFGFLDDSPGSIRFEGAGSEFLEFNGPFLGLDGNGIALTEGATLSVVGGDVSVTDGVLDTGPFGQFRVESRLRAPAGRINIVSVGSPGEVEIAEMGDDAGSFDQLGDVEILFDTVPLGGDVIEGSFLATNVIDASGPGAGQVVVRSGRLTLDKGFIGADTQAGQSGSGLGIDMDVRDALRLSRGSFITTDVSAGAAGAARDIRVAADSITIDGASVIGSRTNVFNEAGDFMPSTGDGGDIVIAARQLTVRGGSAVQTAAQAFGNGGDIAITVDDLVIEEGGLLEAVTVGPGDGGNLEVAFQSAALHGSLGSFTGISVQSLGPGDAGTLTLIGGDLTVTGGAEVSGSAFGEGRGADVSVNVHNATLLGGGSAVRAQAHGAGSAGNVVFGADTLVVRNGASIDTAVTGTGDGGTVSVTARELLLSGDGSPNPTGISAENQGDGDAGAITVRAQRLEVRNGAVISAITRGAGRGGALNIAADSVLLSGEGVGSFTGVTAQTQGDGDAGRVVLRAGNLTLTGGAVIEASVFGAGRGGNVDVVVSNTAQFTGLRSGLFSSAQKNSTGRGGDVSLSAHDVLLSGGATLSAKSLGTGEAGSVRIAATNRFMSEGSSVTTEALLADGGNIDLQVGFLLNLNRAVIATSVGSGEGDGGNIAIDPVFVVLDASRIQANAFGGAGGNIGIVTNFIFTSPDSIIEASSALGIDGTVNIDAPDTDVSGSLVVLPGQFQDPGGLLRVPCRQRADVGRSSFIEGSRGGLPPAPGGFLGAAVGDPGNIGGSTAWVYPRVAYRTDPADAFASSGCGS